MYTAAIKQYVDEATARLNSTHEEYRHSKSWQIVRELSGNNSAPYTKIPGNNSSERLQVWYDHFKSLLGENRPSPDLSLPFFNNKVSDELPVNCAPFTQEGLISALSTVKKALEELY